MIDKIIFLDFDGVVNNFSEPESLHQLSMKNVKVLNRLIELTKAKIVITSVWRISHSLNDLKQILVNAGFKYPNSIIDVTPRGYGTRGSEIVQWLDGKEVSAFVILDDDSDMEPHMNKLIKIDSGIGLTYKKIKSICKILGE